MRASCPSSCLSFIYDMSRDGKKEKLPSFPGGRCAEKEVWILTTWRKGGATPENPVSLMPQKDPNIPQSASANPYPLEPHQALRSVSQFPSFRHVTWMPRQSCSDSSHQYSSIYFSHRFSSIVSFQWHHICRDIFSFKWHHQCRGTFSSHWFWIISFFCHC